MTDETRELWNKIFLFFLLTNDKDIRICNGTEVPQSRLKLLEADLFFIFICLFLFAISNWMNI